MFPSPSLKYLALLLSFLLPFSRSKAETVWWEAESSTDTTMSTEGPYHPGKEDAELISGGEWLNGPVEPGLYAGYDVKVADGGRYTFFARRFWLHGAFRWRFDDGEWVTVQGLKQTVVDQVKLSKGPACWVDLGYVELKPGAHKLRIEMVTETDFKFNTAFAFDCFALSNDGFSPQGANKEGGPRKPLMKVNKDDLGRFLPRTMALLESSTPEHRTPLNILFYGQSIVANSSIDLALTKFLREKYPNAEIRFKNLAIGGYQAPILRKTAWQDMYPKNPDLVVFHVYGGEEGELEEIFKTIKENMTAEVLTWTHHVDNFGTGIDNQRDASSEIWKTLCSKYSFEIADARTRWKEYLKETHLDCKVLLVDQIHLNSKGTALLEECLAPHFQINAGASQDWKKKVRTLSLAQPAPGVTYDSSAWSASASGLVSSAANLKPLKVEFFGNRVDLVSLPGGVGAGSAKILLDGTSPASQRDTLAASRSTIAPNVWWPIITQVTLGDKAIVEKYTFAFHDVAPDGATYAFDVKGSVSGDEGSGQSGKDFVSRSGHFSIKAEDIALSTVKKVTKKELPSQFTAEWEVYSMSKDAWKPAGTLKPGIVPQETVIRCWKDGRHVLEIVPNGNGVIGIKELVVFSPNGQG